MIKLKKQKAKQKVRIINVFETKIIRIFFVTIFDLIFELDFLLDGKYIAK